MLANRRISVVDDDESSRSSMVALLRSFGCSAQAYDSADAFLADTTTHWECIISDIHMPGTDGFQLLSALKRRQAPSPVILMTAYPASSARQKALAAGAARFLEKPVDEDLLLGCLASLLGEVA